MDNEQPVGIMFFSYEWSDWRNGVFYWLQSNYAKNNDEHIQLAMVNFATEYGKKNGSCGFRL